MTSTDDPATAVVHLDGQTHTVPWPRDEKLLDVLLDKGIEAPYSCREGHCGACAVTKLDGEVEIVYVAEHGALVGRDVQVREAREARRVAVVWRVNILEREAGRRAGREEGVRKRNNE